MPASPTTTAYTSGDFTAARSLLAHGESEALALQLLVAKRARQRDLQRAVATKAAKMLAELGSQARAADLDLLVTLVELAAAEAERECGRWGDAAV
jgi:NTP pyrophosphatase (non-canonical NTP hydrolase)